MHTAEKGYIEGPHKVITRGFIAQMLAAGKMPPSELLANAKSVVSHSMYMSPVAPMGDDSALMNARANLGKVWAIHAGEAMACVGVAGKDQQLARAFVAPATRLYIGPIGIMGCHSMADNASTVGGQQILGIILFLCKLRGLHLEQIWCLPVLVVIVVRKQCHQRKFLDS